MTAPVVSWYNADNTEPVSSWEIGLLTRKTSEPTTFLIWNNRGGEEDVRHAGLSDHNHLTTPATKWTSSKTSG